MKVKMKKVLVTGAGGYIGKHIINELLKEDCKVIAVDIRKAGMPDGVEFIEHNILDDAENPNLYELLGKPDVVIHAAWQNGFNHNDIVHMTALPKHYLFIRNLIDSGCKNISVMGTMHEVGYWEGAIDENTPCSPLSLYGVSKNALRQSVLIYAEGKDVLIKWLRAYYITGDDMRNQSIFAKILGFEKEGKTTFPFTDGKNKYDFIDVKDLAHMIVKASIQEKYSGIINCCTGEPVSLKDKVEAFLKEKGLKIRPEYGVFPTRKYDSPCVYGDSTKIRQILGEV